MIRVLHTFEDAIDGLAAEVATLREAPGCVTAELFATLATGESAQALTAVFTTEDAYGAAWDRVLAGEFPLLRGALKDSASTEFYWRTAFALREGVWVPEDSDDAARRIMWPARGEVRIIITNAVEATPAMYDKIRGEIVDTRGEQGCLEYAWYENVELPGHLMLLEVWSDQVIYDRHWALRGMTAAFNGDNLRKPAEPQRGLVSREFYRRQCFSQHYDRWLPAEASGYATTIVYPAS